MTHRYFEVPFYKDLTKISGWNQLDEKATKYHVARLIFMLDDSQMPGSSKIGNKINTMGSPNGYTSEITKTIERTTEVFTEIKTIEKSIIESTLATKVIDELCAEFGDGKILKFGGNASAEFSESTKHSLQQEFQITNSVRESINVKFEFKNMVSNENTERACGVTVYQKHKAVLYLMCVDFLNLEYKRSKLGLRKKLTKYPFPNSRNNKRSTHPNTIRFGVPIVELQYWELLPESSLIIKDADYVQEVEDDSEIEVSIPSSKIKSRPYWNSYEYPSLYQLSRVAFPFKWINKQQNNLSKEELMKIELGEAEESGWWYQHGPGRPIKKHKIIPFSSAAD